MEILERGGADEPVLGLDRATREALMIYCARRWPMGRRKAAQREWDLSGDEARGSRPLDADDGRSEVGR